ncbi:hypothetical protein [Neoroseomonas lacus]|uniref:Uncharacterized protein n=1 Tax=Neoroseomonas lacus TaxID=287609 RepID=A0A917KRJ8_9PROT|nr:hypothetical protein [Neoroseomonas lacus]GGJ24477.1 hypothetical protein GCM10011320_34750 [Neoroseomonas lacus]
MSRRFRCLSGAALALMLAAPAAFAQTPSPAMQRAILDGMNAETRSEVERRATGGNSVYEVLRITLLNNMQLANLIQPGEPPLSEVVAIDFVRGTAVVRQGDRLRAVNFDAQTLRYKP